MRRTERTARLAPPLTAMGAVCALLAGCSFFSRDPEVATGGTFRGPPMRLDSTERVHVVTMDAPNPGWGLEFDRADEAAGPTRLLVSVRRPDPTFLYTQQVVAKSVATTVRVEQPAEVFARVIEHDARKPSTPYERVLLGTGPE